MEGARLIHRLKLQHFLSYGPAGVEIELQPLNVLIGPNASGKSNLIEALGVLRASATNLAAYFQGRGGVEDYIYRGPGSTRIARIQATIEYPHFSGDPILHSLHFNSVGYRLGVVRETIDVPFASGDGDAVGPVYRYDGTTAEMSVYDAQPRVRSWVALGRDDLRGDQSILSQRVDPQRLPEITYLASKYAHNALFQEWVFGRGTPVRLPQRVDLPVDFLLNDTSNLALILHDLMQESSTRTPLLEYLKRLYDAAEYLPTKIVGGTIQLFVDEGAGGLVPASRLSDGTLRYLCLLAILLHPSPPPLVCIEEPELGLHPDLIPAVAELLRGASERTQLVVTTHSDALVSALSDTPDAVIVCEPGPGGTSLRRLDAQALEQWLGEYSLGEMWRIGQIGGTRW